MAYQLLTREDVKNCFYSPRYSRLSSIPEYTGARILLNHLETLYGEKAGLDRFIDVLLNPAVADAVQKGDELIKYERLWDVGTDQETWNLKKTLLQLFDTRQERAVLAKPRLLYDSGSIIYDFYRALLAKKLDRYIDEHVTEELFIER